MKHPCRIFCKRDRDRKPPEASRETVGARPMPAPETEPCSAGHDWEYLLYEDSRWDAENGQWRYDEGYFRCRRCGECMDEETYYRFPYQEAAKRQEEKKGSRTGGSPEGCSK